jgi:cytochrome P450
MPAALQTLAWWQRPIPFFLRGRERFGARWTANLAVTPPFVVLSDPDDVREVLTAPPDVLHPGEGAKVLLPVMGPNSVILLDEDAHLEQRRLMLPAFKGDRMAGLTGMVTEVVEAAVERWPRERPVALHPRLQALTLDIILRAVFGLDEGPRLARLRVLLTELMDHAAGPAMMLPVLQRDLGPRSPWGRFQRVGAEVDELLAAQVAERRAAAAAGEMRRDVLAMLLQARHEDGTEMAFSEIRDELVTALVAGHETTASQLAWTLALLARAPAAHDRLVAELDGGDDAYLEAVIHEGLRHRPVLEDNAPRLTKREVTIGGWTYPEGVVLSNNAFLIHHDPAIYPDPWAFRPERFLDRAPGTYTFLPFGGGRRRCLGASFAMLEMRIVLRTLLRDATLEPLGTPVPRTLRRAITVSPRDGATVTLRPRPGAGQNGRSRSSASAAPAAA